MQLNKKIYYLHQVIIHRFYLNTFTYWKTSLTYNTLLDYNTSLITYNTTLITYNTLRYLITANITYKLQNKPTDIRYWRCNKHLQHWTADEININKSKPWDSIALFTLNTNTYLPKFQTAQFPTWQDKHKYLKVLALTTLSRLKQLKFRFPWVDHKIGTVLFRSTVDLAFSYKEFFNIEEG